MSRAGLPVVLALSIAFAGLPEVSAAAGYLPEAAVPEGWALAGEPSAFDADNLYEHINGAAPGYLRYDFRQLTVQPVQQADDPKTQILVEVYEFGRRLDAFGIYSNERAPGLDFVRLGSEGYFTGPACRFYKGSYYVKLNGTRTDEAVQEAEAAIASALARGLPGRADAPPLLEAFPKEGLVAGSERYEGSDLLAHDFMGAGFIGDYQLGGEKDSKLFFSIKETPREARHAYWELLRFLRNRGEVGERFSLDGAKGRRVTHPFYGPSLVCRSGTVVCGVLRTPSDETGQRLLAELLMRMAELDDG
jgi:hypothetical protein